MSTAPSPSPISAEPGNGRLVVRLVGLAWRYRRQCLRVLGLQLVLLTLGLSGLSLTGIGIDYIRHELGLRGGGEPVARPSGILGFSLPDEWQAAQVIALIAGCILLFAVLRAFLNYAYTISVNRLVQQHLVIDLRAEIYDKLQRLSFRFFDANTTGSIITRVTGDVQAVRMFVDQVLIQSVIMAVSLVVGVLGVIVALGVEERHRGDRQAARTDRRQRLGDERILVR